MGQKNLFKSHYVLGYAESFVGVVHLHVLQAEAICITAKPTFLEETHSNVVFIELNSFLSVKGWLYDMYMGREPHFPGLKGLDQNGHMCRLG